MSLESKTLKPEVLPPLKKGEPFNKEKMIEEYNLLVKVYDHLNQKGRIPNDNLDVVERRRETLTKMRELASQLNLSEQLLWVEERMKNFLISIPK